ncbi:MAG: biotin/lipoyl-binding protein [Propionibacteriaceae bacterium]|jgi:methylmalonyl-CoA carboxyltransferase small subunit|nr:biotin/lipoyl-binding protein [Propionibacteriaceae bacterium]
MKLKVTVNSIPYEVEVEVAGQGGRLPAIVIGGGAPVATPAAAKKSAGSAPVAAAGSGGTIVAAPLAGTVNRFLVEVGETVAEGDVLVILEAMKMETEITAPGAGKVTQVYVAQGDPVQGGQALLEIS